MSDAWIDELTRYAAEFGQRTAARRISYSASVVSQVLSGTYKGDLSAVRSAVEGALMAGTVSCPALGQEIGTHDCLRFQRLPLAATSPARVKLYRTCPACPNNRSRKPKETGDAA